MRRYCCLFACLYLLWYSRAQHELRKQNLSKRLQLVRAKTITNIPMATTFKRCITNYWRLMVIRLVIKTAF